jgi:Uma2 family endonuclease
MNKKTHGATPSQEAIQSITPAKKSFTFTDYVTWPDDQRWELIDGKPFAMGSPTPEHQEILGEFITQFRTFYGGNIVGFPDLDVLFPKKMRLMRK